MRKDGHSARGDGCVSTPYTHSSQAAREKTDEIFTDTKQLEARVRRETAELGRMRKAEESAGAAARLGPRRQTQKGAPRATHPHYESAGAC